MKKIIWAIAAAFVLWSLMFSPWTAPHINFWVGITVSAVILTAISLMLTPDFKKQWKFDFREIALGIAAAAVLWGIFWVGDKVSSWMFPFEKSQVAAIYGLRSQGNPWIIGLALFFIIGPAEEIFWRGTVLRAFLNRFKWPWAVALGVIVYALVHILSLNFMLIMAAAVCGLFWCLFYTWRRNLTALVISHCLWDVSVFLIFPI